MVILHCRGVLMEGRNVVDYRFLAIITGSRTSISITYILFLTEMQKRQTLQKRFALIKKRSVVGFLFARQSQNLDLKSYMSVFIL